MSSCWWDQNVLIYHIIFRIKQKNRHAYIHINYIINLYLLYFTIIEIRP